MAYNYGIRHDNSPKTHIIAESKSKDHRPWTAYCGRGVDMMVARPHHIEPRERICQRCAYLAARELTIDGPVDRTTVALKYDRWVIDRIDGTPLRPLAWAS